MTDKEQELARKMLAWKDARYCVHGHRWDAYTTYLWWNGKTWHRLCRECLKLRTRKRQGYKGTKKTRQDES